MLSAKWSITGKQAGKRYWFRHDSLYPHHLEYVDTAYAHDQGHRL
ncbi:hypothetical protein [Nitrincola sp.]